MQTNLFGLVFFLLLWNIIIMGRLIKLEKYSWNDGCLSLNLDRITGDEYKEGRHEKWHGRVGKRVKEKQRHHHNGSLGFGLRRIRSFVTIFILGVTQVNCLEWDSIKKADRTRTFTGKSSKLQIRPNKYLFRARKFRHHHLQILPKSLFRSRKQYRIMASWFFSAIALNLLYIP